ncbi:MAG: Flp pilus assembly protein CpaB [Hyphomicrobium sp.]
MKRAQLIGISIAAVAGILAVVMVQGMVNKPPVIVEKEHTIKATQVLTARVDIGLGQVATENLFRWQEWPSDSAVGPGFVTDKISPGAMSQFSGSIARAPIMAGEPITSAKLIKAGQGGILAAILPAGMRAISTKIKEETAVGRLIMPNDRVDVILIRRMRGRTGGEEHVSDTLFSNVRVLALGQQIETKEGKKSAESNAATATLELTPKQSEMLALANSMGEISLSLRSIADLQAEGMNPSAIEDFNKTKTSNAVRVMRYGVKSRAYGVN